MFKSLINRILSNKLFSDSIWSILGSVLGRGLTVIAGVIVARLLGRDIYGEYGLIKNTLLYIEIFSTFGIGYTATKYVAEFRKDDPSKLKAVCKVANTITLCTSSFIAILMFVFSNYISVLVDAPHLSPVLRLSSIAIIFNAVNVSQIGILSGYQEFRGIAINTTFNGIITFILTVILTYYYGLSGAVIALVLSYAVQCILNNMLIRRLILSFHEYSKEDKTLYKSLIKYSMPIALQEGLYSVTNWLVSFILIKFTGYGALGMYTASVQVAAIIGFLPSILSNVTLSHLTLSAEDKNRHIKTRNIMLLVNFLSTCFVYVLIMLCSNFISDLFGRSFDGLEVVFGISCITAILSSLSSVYVQECLAINKNWALLGARVVRDFSIIVFGLISLSINSNGGAFYMCLSILVANILYLLILYSYVRLYERNKY